MVVVVGVCFGFLSGDVQASYSLLENFDVDELVSFSFSFPKKLVDVDAKFFVAVGVLIWVLFLALSKLIELVKDVAEAMRKLFSYLLHELAALFVIEAGL